jgi:hypothetical protein
MGPECIVHKERRLMNQGRSIADSADGTCEGKGLIEMLEDLLDGSFDQLMSPAGLEQPELEKGYALGLSTAIAVLTNPYFPNVDVIKAEAVERYEARSALD